jgi:hypothetical protein
MVAVLARSSRTSILILARGSDNEDMTEKEMIRRWVQTWKEFGPELEKLRLREVREEDNLLSLQLLAPAFEHAVRTQPPDEESGLVEMQRHLAKLRR